MDMEGKIASSNELDGPASIKKGEFSTFSSIVSKLAIPSDLVLASFELLDFFFFLTVALRFY